MTNDPPAIPSTTPDDLPGALTLDTLFEVLAHRRRRQVLRILGENGEAMETEELARSLAASEDRDGNGEPPAEAVRSVHRSLYHVHLPKLAEVPLVEYDEERGTVTRTEVAETVAFPPGR